MKDGPRFSEYAVEHRVWVHDNFAELDMFDCNMNSLYLASPSGKTYYHSLE